MSAVEQWRAIPGYVGSYEASDHGRVRSLTRTTERGRKLTGQILTQSTQVSGYKTVSLWRNGKQRSPLVHRLVLLAFIGQPADGEEALHADGNRTNNALTNLSWGTHSANQRDQIAHGRHANTTKTHCARGHAFTPENTYHYPNRRHRACRKCRRTWTAQHKQKASA